MNNAERLKGLDEIAKDLGSLEYQAAKRGMYLTVHAIHPRATGKKLFKPTAANLIKMNSRVVAYDCFGGA